LTDIYSFHEDFMERSELGNKGANLVAMTHLKLPVPPGFVISVKSYKIWRETGVFPEGEIIHALTSTDDNV
jgi:phosphoenolpyruvate synthase/pyruvate phosphate dikinase